MSDPRARERLVIGLLALAPACASRRSTPQHTSPPAGVASSQTPQGRPPPAPADSVASSSSAPSAVGADAGASTLAPEDYDAPKSVAGTACCWPGQSQDPDTAACVGVPRCPADLRPSQRGCAPKVAAAELAAIPAGSTRFEGGAVWVGKFELELAAVSVAQYASQDATPYGAQAHNQECALASMDDAAAANCLGHSQAEEYCKAIGRRLPTAPELSRAADYASKSARALFNEAPGIRFWTDTFHKHCWHLPCSEPPMEGQAPRILACGRPKHAEDDPCRALLVGSSSPNVLIRCASD